MTEAGKEPSYMQREMQRLRRESDEYDKTRGADAAAGPPDLELPGPLRHTPTAADVHQHLTEFLHAVDVQEGESPAAKLRRLVALDGEFQTLFREAITHQAEAIEHEAERVHKPKESP